ncbi:MAG TPA: toxin-antitoxin system HicB family antitoxin [Acidimicrobiia bacterium]|nr:toxin-antitoxin system HicB family antitoxin [Acidimicrobiia bacterium]
MIDRKSFLLRLNPRLHRVLERWAADDMRSLNAQIEFLLANAARRAGRWEEGSHQAEGEGAS